MVEDEDLLAERVQDGLRRHGLEVHRAATIQGARARLRETWDILLFDVNLPDGSGIELAQLAQEVCPQTPIIMLTGRADEETAIRGFSAGVVDFVRKPVGHRELMVRIRRALGDRNFLRVGSLAVAAHSREVTIKGQLIKLPPREFDILLALAKTPEQLVPRETLLADLVDDDDSALRSLDGHVSRLRRRLRMAGAEDLKITTSYGLGYMLKKSA